MLPAEDRGPGPGLPGRATRLRLGERPRRDAADDAPPLGPDPRPPRAGAARVAGVLRGHAGGGGRGGPAGCQPGRLRLPTGGREGGHPVGFGHAHSRALLFGPRPAVDPRFSGPLPEPAVPRPGLLEAVRRADKVADAPAGRAPGSVPGRGRPAARDGNEPAGRWPRAAAAPGVVLAVPRRQAARLAAAD